MSSNGKSLSSGLEDYIETIYAAKIADEDLKGADLARKLNVSRASVSEALGKLVTKGLIQYNSYETISLTQEGVQEAKKVYEKHNILKLFFESVLGIPSLEAGENACKIEHIISENILNEITKFTNFWLDHKEFSKMYTKKNKP